MPRIRARDVTCWFPLPFGSRCEAHPHSTRHGFLNAYDISLGACIGVAAGAWYFAGEAGMVFAITVVCLAELVRELKR